MSEAWLETIKIVLSAVGGGGLTFIAILLKRKWEKQDKKDELMNALKETNEKIDELQKTVMDELKKVRDEAEEYHAKQSRARILQFNDELMRNVLHTKESFDDLISEVDYYEKFSESHPKFPNFKAVAAIENIKTTYKKRLKENDFI
jgi:hypothetical protein